MTPTCTITHELLNSFSYRNHQFSIRLRRSAVVLTFASHGPLEPAPLIKSDTTNATYGCPREGEPPHHSCESWGNDSCYFDARNVPEWYINMAQFGTETSAFPECTTIKEKSCANVTNSARVLAAMACDEVYGRLRELYMSELASLPPGQLRVGDGGMEFNVAAIMPKANASNRGLQTPKCSANFVHTCKRVSTSFVFNSKFIIHVGSGLEASRGWRNSPEAVVTMDVRELSSWEAMCSKSSLHVAKQHHFKAGSNTVTRDETTSGESTRMVYPRCVVWTTFAWDA